MNCFPRTHTGDVQLQTRAGGPTIPSKTTELWPPVTTWQPLTRRLKPTGISDIPGHGPRCRATPGEGDATVSWTDVHQLLTNRFRYVGVEPTQAEPLA